MQTGGCFLLQLDNIIKFKDPESIAFEVTGDELATMSLQGSSFYLGWTRGTLIYNKSLSPRRHKLAASLGCVFANSYIMDEGALIKTSAL